LEVRVPFLDHQVVDLAFDLHQSLKLNEKGRKQVLLEAFRNELPAELFNRSKQGFEVPLLDWMRNELKSTLDELVFNRERIEAQGLFNFTYLMMVRQRLHGNSPGDVPILVWQLFVFQRWWNNYFSS
jgi:asparagine synthase (glutamine-hydrolysing)